MSQDSRPSSFFDRPLHRIEVAGGTTAYRTMGTGSPVLLIHGYPETHVCWHAVADRLAASHTVIAVDLPGYGDSWITRRPWTR